MELSLEDVPGKMVKLIVGRLTAVDLQRYGEHAVRGVVEKVIDEAVKIVLKEKLPEIMAAIDTKSIANMAIAQAAGEIAKSLTAKGPDLQEMSRRLMER